MAQLISIDAKGANLPSLALPLPAIAWIELTSKCPVDCVFCSRKAARGNGEHMPFDLYTRLLRELEGPLVLRLSYSGESGHYPRLIEALDAAGATGARVELVTALVSVPEKTVRAMAERLDRITLSLHTTDDEEFRRIYRYGSFGEFERRFAILEEVRLARGKPKLDFAFVALESNLSSLEGVVQLARDRYVEDVIVQPVMRREDFEYGFPELDAHNQYTRAFAARLRGAVEMVRSRYSGVRLQIDHPDIESCGEQTGPEAGQIIACAEDPWQTIHVMSNGAVISCGWRQAQPLGNLSSASLRQIWQGPAYKAFRKAHREGCDPVCRQCAYKTTHPVAPLPPRLTAESASVRQMPAGWFEHDRDGGILWAGAHAVIEMPGRFPSLRLVGGLPPGPLGDPNVLIIRANGVEIISIENPSQTGMLHFDRVVQLPEIAHPARVIQFAARHEFVPRDRGQSEDSRRLGFYLELVECVETGTDQRDSYTELLPGKQSRRRVQRLRRGVALADAVAARVRPLATRHSPPAVRTARPGLSVIIPERDSPHLLEQCLQSVTEAARHWPDPLQVVVMANGVLPQAYAALRARHPDVDFVCERQPLSFCGAVRRGLRRARHDWIYLLNSDMVLEPNALAALAGERGDSVFALASRMFLADQGCLPTETNWTAYRVVDGLFEVFHAAPPEGAGPFEILFGSGGCTLYRRRLLEHYLGRQDPYTPFYFEDLDWATRGWRDGFRSLLCPASVATHQRRATINRFYGPAEAERIFERNRLLYQLRYVIAGVSPDAVLQRIEWAPPRSLDDLTGWRTLASIVISRFKSGVLGAGCLPGPYARAPQRLVIG